MEKWGKTSPMSRIAESWELSAFPKCESIVASGKYRGFTILELQEIFPDLLGEKADLFSVFPLLIKIIDATKDLSVQVHPNDEFALINEHELGKTEMWYVAEADEGAAIYYGFNKDTTEEELRECIKTGTLTELLNRVEVAEGDTFFVPSGTVHAILAGVTIIEVQESSSITYRLYDYGRKDANGRERELHIEKALQVIDKTHTKVPEQTREYDRYEEAGFAVRALSSCEYFNVKEVEISGEYPISHPTSFVAVTAVCGEGSFDNGYPITKGDTFLVPAGLNVTLSGNLKIIQTTL